MTVQNHNQKFIKYKWTADCVYIVIFLKNEFIKLENNW